MQNSCPFNAHTHLMRNSIPIVCEILYPLYAKFYTHLMRHLCPFNAKFYTHLMRNSIPIVCEILYPFNATLLIKYQFGTFSYPLTIAHSF